MMASTLLIALLFHGVFGACGVFFFLSSSLFVFFVVFFLGIGGEKGNGHETFSG